MTSKGTIGFLQIETTLELLLMWPKRTGYTAVRLERVNIMYKLHKKYRYLGPCEILFSYNSLWF